MTALNPSTLRRVGPEVPRQVRRRSLAGACLWLCAMLAVAGCGSSGPGRRGGQEGDACDAARPCDTNLTCVSGLCADAHTDQGPQGDLGPTLDLGPGVSVTALELTPADPTLQVDVGASGSLQLIATLRLTDGSTQPATGALFSASERTLGAVDSATGEFIANGLLGGSVEISATATVNGRVYSASVTLTVNLRAVIGGGDTGSGDPATLFEGLRSTTRPVVRS